MVVLNWLKAGCYYAWGAPDFAIFLLALWAVSATVTVVGATVALLIIGYEEHSA